MNIRTYHVGIRKDYEHPERVVVELRRNIDYLSCELWEYWGVRMCTKKYIKENKSGILNLINKMYNAHFTKITID